MEVISALPKANKVNKRVKRTYLVLLLILLLGAILSAISINEYHNYSAMYHRDIPMAQAGIKHIETAVTLLEALTKSPLDSNTVIKAHSEFASAYLIFTQLNTDIQSIPSISTLMPIYGSRISAAMHLLPIALEVSQIGLNSCDVLSAVNDKLYNSLSRAKGLTQDDIVPLVKNIQQITKNLTIVIDQVNQLQPSVLQADPRISNFITKFNKDIPLLREVLDAATTFLPLAPTLLGIGTPANYLIEVLDSTELRPGGGFIGNYGIATVASGQLTQVKLEDTYLLDNAFRASGQSLSYPAEYHWFSTIMKLGSWSLRDSNLDADFPTVARYAELNYAHEGGKIPLQGVVAITPAFIQQVLEITGPIVVPGYNQTVTAQNLIGLIHYYQVGAGYAGSDTPSSDGLSSVRKHFMAWLAVNLTQRIHKIAPSHAPELFKLFVNAVHTKDFQAYFNANEAEGLLQRYQFASSIQPATNDGIFVVDANLSPNKANYLITSTLADQVTIDSYGNITHQTTLKYNWAQKGPVYGNSLYSDYVRVYVPAGSKLTSESGWQFYGTDMTFGRSVFVGFFTLNAGQSRTITLSWSTPTPVKKDSNGFHYRDLIQRQAGVQWQVNVHIILPNCATVKDISGGLTSDGKQAAVFSQPLLGDTAIGVDYLC